MRKYDVVLVIHPELDETALKALIEKTKGWITDGGGTVDNVDLWGKRRMAYQIKKQRDAQYVLINSTMAPAFTAELERNLRFTEPVMRFMIAVLE